MAVLCSNVPLLVQTDLAGLYFLHGVCGNGALSPAEVVPSPVLYCNSFSQGLFQRGSMALSQTNQSHVKEREKERKLDEWRGRKREREVNCV